MKKEKTLNISTMFNLHTMINRINTNIRVVVFIVSSHYSALKLYHDLSLSRYLYGSRMICRFISPSKPTMLRVTRVTPRQMWKESFYITPRLTSFLLFFLNSKSSLYCFCLISVMQFTCIYHSVYLIHLICIQKAVLFQHLSFLGA